MKYLKFGFLIFILVISACTGVKKDFALLEEGFTHPDDSLNPWCYYYWVADNVTKEGVTKDLESMAAKGITTAFIGNIGTVDQYQGDVKMLSEEWFDITVHAIKEAQRVGVDLGMFNSPGWSQSGGPWNKAENSMRYLAFSETNLDGPQSFKGKLEKPQHNLSHSFHYNLNVESEEDTIYEDVRVLAFQAPLKDNDHIRQYSTDISGENIRNANAVLDGNKETAAVFQNIKNERDKISIEIKTGDVFEARSLKIYPQPIPVHMDMELMAEINGSYTSIKKFKLNRSNAMISVGFIPYAPVTVSFPAVKAKKFKLVGTNFKILGGGIAELELSGAAGLEFYQEKSLAKMFQTPLPLWNEYKWEPQAEPEDPSLCIDKNTVLDITEFLTEDGTLEWDVPQGNWVIMRIGMYPTGTKNAPSSKEATGLEVDKINKKHVRHHFNSYLKMFIDSIPENERKSFRYVVADSYEQGSQNWTDELDVAFREKYSYDPVPYLPVLSGRLVESAEKSNRFLWDLRRLIADRVAYEYVGGLKEVSNEYGLQVWLENYGHWGFPAEFLQYGGQSDMVGGEFWAEGDLGSIECKAASSSAHIYGKNRVYAESYTSSGKPFERHPALLKKRGDWSYVQGINHTVLTLFIHQPYEDKFPGIMEWYGSEINRFNTWYSQADTWIEYLKRCHFMLQQGNYVADVCYFIGEDAPVMTGTRDPELPEGYSFDYVNSEALITAWVMDGKIHLPSGMSYELLVLPKLKTMTPELLEKISRLVDEGAVIYGNAPEGSPSLMNYPECDKQVIALAGEMWKDPSNLNLYGKGKIYQNMTIQEVMDDLDIVRDFSCINEDVLWTHRHMNGAEIYFISNQTGEKIHIESGFRVEGKQPELWDAVNGSTRILPQFTVKDKQTFVPLLLEPYQSFFLVFKDKPNPGKGENFPG
ncbi:MAG: glycoside hydrolase family 2, partial [Bacteroidales bacterium]|nr:glycoside hydrolase family 2 [Bacteroidales bacterium]